MGGHAGAALRITTSASSWRCSQVYDGRLDQVAEVRAFLRKVLDGYPVADDATLLASELAANAILHSDSQRSSGQFTVRAELHDGDYVWVEVEDQGGLWEVEADRPDGRWHGLDIVNAVASEWGREQGDEGGWVVWFRIDWPDSAARELDACGGEKCTATVSTAAQGRPPHLEDAQGTS